MIIKQLLMSKPSLHFQSDVSLLFLLSLTCPMCISHFHATFCSGAPASHKIICQWSPLGQRREAREPCPPGPWLASDAWCQVVQLDSMIQDVCHIPVSAFSAVSMALVPCCQHRNPPEAPTPALALLSGLSHGGDDLQEMPSLSPCLSLCVSSMNDSVFFVTTMWTCGAAFTSSVYHFFFFFFSSTWFLKISFPSTSSLTEVR